MGETWDWQTQNGYSFLTTSLLKRWRHGFFSRDAWPHTPDVLSPDLAGAAEVFRARQVHGDRIVSAADFDVPAATAPLDLPAADALVAVAARQAVWVCTADCTPALIADDATGRVAAIHAGWRGTALGIVAKTAAQMQAQGSRLQDLRIALGPAISGEVYQVTTHVALEVGQSLAVDIAAPQNLLDCLQSHEFAAVLPDQQPGRVRLDIRRINVLQLQQMGIEPEQIAVAPHCTYQEPERFFSYRRTREKKVQWSGIVSG